MVVTLLNMMNDIPNVLPSIDVHSSPGYIFVLLCVFLLDADMLARCTNSSLVLRQRILRVIKRRNAYCNFKARDSEV